MVVKPTAADTHARVTGIEIFFLQNIKGDSDETAELGKRWWSAGIRHCTVC